MNKLLKLSTALLLSTSSICSAEAPVEVVQLEQDTSTNQLPYGFTLGPKVRIGLPTGIGAELAMAINKDFVVKCNISYIPKSILEMIHDTIRKNSSMRAILAGSTASEINNLNIMAQVDWHPFGNSFMLSAGGAYNKLRGGVTHKVPAALLVQAARLSAGTIIPDLSAHNLVEQTDNFFFVSGIGFDNSNDLESRFNYGVSLEIMLGKFSAKNKVSFDPLPDNSNVTAADKQKMTQFLDQQVKATEIQLNDEFKREIEELHKRIGLCVLPMPSLTVKFGIALQ